ncbi:helix-turn-helix domain containing protein, partial [Clostridium bornimense]|uniref:helix-turn-helix domain-containing protein n=1 Tax=Clostridium bornimense TaxID=1216932 RepID=UPI001C0FF993
MAKSKRKTTIEERKEIVKYCIEHGNDYKNTAEKFSVFYTQVYTWVRKYKVDGEDG